MKEPVVTPDAFPKLLVDSNEVGGLLPGFEFLRCPMEFTVFRQAATRQKFRLI